MLVGRGQPVPRSILTLGRNGALNSEQISAQKDQPSQKDLCVVEGADRSLLQFGKK